MPELYQSEDYIYDSVPIKIYNQCYDGERIFTPMHWHQSLEFNLTTKGRILRNLGGVVVEQHPGDWSITNSAVVHSDHWVDVNDHFEGITLQISKFLIDRWIGKDVQFRTPPDPVGNALCIQELLRFGELRSRTDHYDLETMELLFHFLALLRRYCLVPEQEMDKIKSGEISTIKEIIHYIDAHHEEPLSLSDIADTFGYSTAHLSRIFKKHIGMNFLAYLQQVRLSYSIDLLKENRDIKLSDCAMQCGFPNVKSFITTFKRHFGCTPSDWLKRRNMPV